jgi:hypothetical protein
VELIVLLLLSLPLGFLIKSRVAAYLAYVGVHSFVFTFQTLTLTRAWVGGDTAAFDQDPNAVPWPYAVVNLAIYGIGLGLVALGHRLAAGRRARRSAVVNLA